MDKLSKRPKVSQHVIDIVTNLVDAQDVKGWEKYGETIDSAQDQAYDWNRMALEETVDGMKYLVKRVQQLERTNQQLAYLHDTVYAENKELGLENSQLKHQVDYLKRELAQYTF